MDKDYINGLMVDAFKDFGKIIKWKDQEYLLGKMEESII